VNKIDALTITQRIVSSGAGESRYAQTGAELLLEMPNLAITLPEVDSEAFRRWHEDFVIKGNNGDDAEKNGTLEYLGPNLKDVLFTLTFRHLGIFKLTPEKFDAERENIRRLRAEMYCEEIRFQPGASVASGKGAGTGAGATTTTPVYSGTPVASPVYAQPVYSGTQVASPVYAQAFAADLAYKSQLSQDVVAVPLRLGRALKFRS
jgi:hypothetical protein